VRFHYAISFELVPYAQTQNGVLAGLGEAKCAADSDMESLPNSDSRFTPATIRYESETRRNMLATLPPSIFYSNAIVWRIWIEIAFSALNLIDPDRPCVTVWRGTESCKRLLRKLHL